MLITQIIYQLLNYCLRILICVRFHRTYSRLRDCALTSLRVSGKINENNLLKEEHLSLKDLMKNINLITQNADKGNTVVVLNENDYISKMKVILIESSKFR